MEIAGKSGN